MGPQVGFQVKEEVRIGLGFDWAVVGLRMVVKKRRVGRNESAESEKERMSKKQYIGRMTNCMNAYKRR